MGRQVWSWAGRFAHVCLRGETDFQGHFHLRNVARSPNPPVSVRVIPIPLRGAVLSVSTEMLPPGLGGLTGGSPRHQVGIVAEAVEASAVWDQGREASHRISLLSSWIQEIEEVSDLEKISLL